VWDHERGRVVLPVLRHGWLNGVPDALQPFSERLFDGSLRLLDVAPSFIVPHRCPASLRCCAFGPDTALARLATSACRRIGVDIEAVGPCSAAPVDVPLHAAGLSVSMNSRSLAATMYTRRPSRFVGRSPVLAKR